MKYLVLIYYQGDDEDRFSCSYFAKDLSIHGEFIEFIDTFTNEENSINMLDVARICIVPN